MNVDCWHMTDMQIGPDLTDCDRLDKIKPELNRASTCLTSSQSLYRIRQAGFYLEVAEENGTSLESGQYQENL